MLALMIRVPKPGAVGATVSGPPFSVQCSSRFPDASRPFHLDAARRCGKRAVFGGVGDKLVEGESQALGGRGPQRHVGA